ncbi:MAG: serine/threonine-protein kinase, partial [Solirubrobacterales bacterium]
MPDDPAIGSTLAGYRLDALIARGGMGVVYRATHLALDRPVALKVIARQFAGDQGFRDRFLRESRLAARLDHPAVVPVYDAREEDGELIVAMRLIGGGDLKKRIASDGPLQPAEAVALLGQVADALDAAHAAGIVHRDVKPHNILLEGDRAYLTDFGLAKALGDSGVLSGTSVVGTVEYMSPEQWRGDQVGPAADVYSLGCVLYESLTGVVPFGRREGEAEPEMPQGLDAVIERAVAADPAQRYASAGELIEAAHERQGATPAATRVLSDTANRPTLGRAVAPESVLASERRH